MWKEFLLFIEFLPVKWCDSFCILPLVSDNSFLLPYFTSVQTVNLRLQSIYYWFLLFPLIIVPIDQLFQLILLIQHLRHDVLFLELLNEELFYENVQVLSEVYQSLCIYLLTLFLPFTHSICILRLFSAPLYFEFLSMLVLISTFHSNIRFE